MNPLLLAGLLIGGSVVGIGGVYFSYPHIANLISPDQDESVEVTSSKAGNTQNQPTVSSSITTTGQTGNQQSSPGSGTDTSSNSRGETQTGGSSSTQPGASGTGGQGGGS